MKNQLKFKMENKADISKQLNYLVSSNYKKDKKLLVSYNKLK